MPLSGCIKCLWKRTGEKLEELKTNFSKSAPQKNTNLNWWDYEIGTPRALTNTLILLKEDLLMKKRKIHCPY